MSRFKIAGNYRSSYERKEMQHKNNLSKNIVYMYKKKVTKSWRKQCGYELLGQVELHSFHVQFKAFIIF